MQVTQDAALSTRPPLIAWWAWPTGVVAAIALVNAVPHTLAGPLILNLPTPFSGGPGTLSSPMVNLLWGLSNIAIGGGLMTRIRPWLPRPALHWTMIAAAVIFVVFLTWAIGSLPLPNRFAE